jgi:hypothetical protein
VKYIALGPARIRETRHINNIASCSILNGTAIFVETGRRRLYNLNHTQFSQKSKKFHTKSANCLCTFTFLLLTFFNPYPANLDNMASSYQC